RRAVPRQRVAHGGAVRRRLGREDQALLVGVEPAAAEHAADDQEPEHEPGGHGALPLPGERGRRSPPPEPGRWVPVTRGSGVVAAEDSRAPDIEGSAMVASVENETERPLSSTPISS